MVRSLALCAAAALGLSLAAPTPAHANGAGATRPDDADDQDKKKTPPKKKKKGKGKKGKGKKGKKGKKKKTPGIGPFPKKKYPVAERLRPLVLPDGMGEVGVDLGITRIADVTGVGVNASFAYGVGDVVDFGVSTGLLLAPAVDWSNTLTLQGHYLAYDSKDLDFAPGVVLPLVFADPMPFSIVLDLPTRYVLDKLVYFYFGQNAVPVVISPDFALSVAANGGVGFQVDKSVVLFVDANVATLLLVPDAGITGPWETLQIGGGGQYSWSRYGDVGARLDLANTWEVDGSLFFTVSVYGRFRF